MNDQELRIIANFLYSLYANALIDLEIQKYYTPFSRLHQTIRANLSDPNNSGNELIQFNNLIEKLTSLVRIRFVYTKTLNHCLKQCNESNSDIIKSALEGLQLYASKSLYAFSHEYSTEFTNHLEKSAKTISECEKSMHFASEFHKKLSCGELPVIVEDKDKPLTVINLILQSTPSFMHTADALINTFNDVCDCAMTPICLGTDIYKNHYKALYDFITSESVDKQSMALLNDCFMLPNEYHLLLPDVDTVAQHMTETTLLLAQINQ